MHYFLVSVAISTVLLFVHQSVEVLEHYVQFVLVILFLNIALLDVYSRMIPNKYLLLLLSGALFLLNTSLVMEYILAGTIVFLGVSAVNVLFYRLKGQYGFGWGDVKLLAVLGLWLGYDAFWVLITGIMIGGLYGILIMAVQKEHASKNLPFGLFLFLGYVLVEYVPVMQKVMTFYSVG